MNIYYDIETGVDETVDPFDFHNPYPPYTEDGLKIGAKDRIPPEEKKAKHLSEYEEKRNAHDAAILDRLKLSPATGKIVAIGVARDQEPTRIISGPETDILNEFWDYHHELSKERNGKARWWNWTGKNKPDNFDLNYLVRRSWKHSIKMPWVDREQFRNVAADFLKWESWQDGHMRLERAALSLGIDVMTFSNVCGKTFSEAFLSDDAALRNEAVAYLMQDIGLLRQIHQRISQH